MSKILEVKNITHSYSKNDFALRDINFSLKEGVNYALIGLSGSGKSTLLKCIAGLLSLSKGTIVFKSEKVLGPHEQLIPRHPSIAYHSQDFSLDTYHTVKENIRLKILHLDYKERDKKTNELLEITGLNDFKYKSPHELSGGQKQKLAFARAVADSPELLLLDEAFNQLDIKNRSKLSGYLKKSFAKQMTTTIWVSHDPEDIFRWADQVLVMHKGKLTRKTTPENLYKFPKTEYEAALLGDFITHGIKQNKIYIRPENIVFSDKPTQQEAIITKTFFKSGKYHCQLEWNNQNIEVPSNTYIEPGIHYININTYACKTD